MAKKPRVIHDIAELREVMGQQRRAGHSVGLVPTMGALHEGHLSLVRAARAECDYTVVTIFVNPTQFGPREDLARYPRTLEADLGALEAQAVDLVFCPAPETMYPPGFSTYVDPPEVARAWEGACRPGHFRGVATVVLKLFQLIPADVAYFGRKDYQQALVIRHLVRDLNVPIRIQVCPIVREPDGLAMSSRNRYLDPSQRRQALALFRALQAARQLVRQGERDVTAVRSAMSDVLAAAEIEHVDYIAIVEPDTLEELPRVKLTMVVLLAAHVGHTRLIDNCRLDEGGLDETA